MYHHLKGKTALITGSTSGIGLAIAKTLSAAGVNITLNGYGDVAEIEKIRLGLQQEYNTKIIYERADMKDRKQIKHMIDRTAAELGPISILVNSAGIQHISKIDDFEDDIYEDIIAINLNATFYTTKYSIPQMRQIGWGRIINIASIHGLIASVNKSAYVASKHGVVGLTKATALELALTQITCNTICPGFVMTQLIKTQITNIAEKQKISFEAAQIKLLEDKQPSLNPIKAESIGELVKFLCSEAAQEIRGASLSIDGGWTIQ